MSPARRALWTALLVLVGAALGAWLYGLGSGGGFYHRLVRAPLAPALAAPYYRESLLHVGLAHLLGLGASLLAFRLAILACFWAALARLTAAALQRLPLAHALLVWLVALTHPAAMIVHAWTCHPDALLLLLATSLLFARRPAAIAAIAALAAWTHLPMAILLAAGTTLLWHGFADDHARRRSLAALTGLLLGAVSCRLTLWLAGVHLARDRLATAAQHDPITLLHYWSDIGWPILYTLHFAHLLWLPALLATLATRSRPAALALLTTQLAALAAAAVSEDTTRIFACLAWPPLLYSTVRALAWLAEPGARDRWRLRPLIALGVVVSLIAPASFAWKGRLHDLTGAHAHLRTLLP